MYFQKYLLLSLLICTFRVNPIYFVCFTTATIIASAILFHGFNTDNPINVASLICGFIIIFAGVYLLDSIARSTLHQAVPLEDEDEEEETLLEQQEVGSSFNLSGLNHDDTDDDDDIELISRPRSRQL